MFCSLLRRLEFTSRELLTCKFICINKMALTCSQKSLQSPLSHMDIYGVEHPFFGTVKATNAKHKSKSSHKSSAGKSKLATGSRTSRKCVKSAITITVRRGHKKSARKAPKTSNGARSISISKLSDTKTPYHSIRHPNVTATCLSSSSLARVDHDSPIQQRVSSQTTSGYTSSKPRHSNLKTTIPDFTSSVPLHSNSSVSTSNTLTSINQSYDNLKSSITSSPININLKRASQTTKGVSSATGCLLFSRSLCTRPGRKPKSLMSDRGKRGESLIAEDIVWKLGRLQYRNVIVMSGAGISTSSGIPDFRSPGTGLYDNLQQYKIPDPTAIFDIGYFSRNPKPFFTLAKELYPGKYRPNTVHHFVRLLQERGLLLRNYTQNIDGLERIAGISPGKLVEAHGSFSTASCIKCKSKQEPEEVKATIFEGKIPRCKHKYCYGLVKPDIVFFGEDLPARFHSLQLRDFSKCDLLIIMGTSLEVEPFASLCTLPKFDVPRLLINRELVGPFKHGRKRVTDVALTGDLVESVREIIDQAGWSDELCQLVKVGSDAATKETVSTNCSNDVQTVASEDRLSSMSVQSDSTLPTQMPHSLSDTNSITNLPPSDDLVLRMAGLTLGKEDSESSLTQPGGSLAWCFPRTKNTDGKEPK